MARRGDDRRRGGRAVAGDAVHLFRRRRSGRQPLLPELLSAVPVPDAGRCPAWPAPPSRSLVGALFTAKILVNPFYASFYPGEHTKVGPLRWLPIELTLLNDLPMAANPDRSRKLLGGTPPVMAYFPGRQRVRSGRRVVLGEGEVAGGRDPPRAGRRRRQRPVRDEGDHDADDRDSERREARSRDRLDRPRIADADDEAGRSRARHPGRSTTACRTGATSSRPATSTASRSRRRAGSSRSSRRRAPPTAASSAPGSIWCRSTRTPRRRSGLRRSLVADSMTERDSMSVSRAG